MQTTKQEREDAENMIFSLLRKAELYLHAGETAEADEIRRAIATLQRIYGVTSGVNRRDENGIGY